MSQVTRRSRVRVLPTHAPGSSLLPFARLGFATRANYIYFFSSLQNRVMTRSDLWFDVLLSFLLVSRIAFFLNRNHLRQNIAQLVRRRRVQKCPPFTRSRCAFSSSVAVKL